jgi:hypothetical protein
MMPLVHRSPPPSHPLQSQPPRADGPAGIGPGPRPPHHQQLARQGAHDPANHVAAEAGHHHTEHDTDPRRGAGGEGGPEGSRGAGGEGGPEGSGHRRVSPGGGPARHVPPAQPPVLRHPHVRTRGALLRTRGKTPDWPASLSTPHRPCLSLPHTQEEAKGAAGVSRLVGDGQGPGGDGPRERRGVPELGAAALHQHHRRGAPEPRRIQVLAPVGVLTARS